MPNISVLLHPNSLIISIIFFFPKIGLSLHNKSSGYLFLTNKYYISDLFIWLCNWMYFNLMANIFISPSITGCLTIVNNFIFEVLMEIRSMNSSKFNLDSMSHGQPADVKHALEAEVQTFDRREQLVSDFKVNILIVSLQTNIFIFCSFR